MKNGEQLILEFMDRVNEKDQPIKQLCEFMDEIVERHKKQLTDAFFEGRARRNSFHNSEAYKLIDENGDK